MTICQWRCTSVGNTCIGRLNTIGPCSQSSIYTSIVYFELLYILYIIQSSIYTSIVYGALIYLHYVGSVSGQSTVFAQRWHEDSIARLGLKTWHLNRIKSLTMWSSYSPEIKKWTSWLSSFHFFLRSTCWSLAWQGWKEEAHPSNILWWETS